MPARHTYLAHCNRRPARLRREASRV